MENKTKLSLEKKTVVILDQKKLQDIVGGKMDHRVVQPDHEIITISMTTPYCMTILNTLL